MITQSDTSRSCSAPIHLREEESAGHHSSGYLHLEVILCERKWPAELVHQGLGGEFVSIVPRRLSAEANLAPANRGEPYKESSDQF